MKTYSLRHAGSRAARYAALGTLGSLLVAGCSSSKGGPEVSVEVGALTLPGLADACYTLRVENGDDEIVWEKTGICADRFGDGRSSISYVGPCDASEGVSDNRVTLILESLHDANDEIARDTYENPCGDGTVAPGDPAYNFDGFGPCQRTFECVENADVSAVFDITVMRDAGQGFFDVAVNFEDIFCSAKVDCNDPDTGATNTLLHNPATNERDATAVAAFACYSGEAETVLHMEDVRIVCGTTTYIVDPTAGPGNIELDEANDPVLFGAAVYEGVEPQQGQGLSYWNVALGIDELALPATGCTIEVRATASEGSWAESAGYIPETHTNYPVLTASIDLSIVAGELQCGAHAVNGDDSDYRTAYASTGRFSPHIFCHELVPGATDLTSTLPNCGVTNLFIGDDGGNAALQIDGAIYSADVPPDAFVDGNGDEVEGAITMIVSPDGFNGSYGVQGDSETVDPDFVADFTFVDENANEVAVAPGALVTIRIPLPPESLYLAGDPIEFYSWDEANDVWVFETIGVVVQEGGALFAEGAVSHFTWYGVKPAKKSCVNVTVVDGDGQPLDDILVRSVVLPASGAYFQAATVDGEVCLETRAQGYKASIQMPSLPAGATVSPALNYTTPAFSTVAACGGACMQLTFTVTLPSSCNGDFQPGEECDGGALCDTDCTCVAGASPAGDGGCTLCGNGDIDVDESCDPLYGNADFCNANCECEPGYVAVSGECAPESDGICGGPADIDCDSVCNAGDSAPDCDGVCAASEDGDDCNNVCDANEGGSNDCNTYCDNNEVAGSPDCDFICQPYENSPTDCNTLCNGGEDNSNDCDFTCQPNEDGPDCNTVCDSSLEDGSNDCNGSCDFNETFSNDCNNLCQGNETSDGTDCDGVCQTGEDSLNDCNGLCNANEGGSNDCNTVCNAGDAGPDCDTFCAYGEEDSDDCDLTCKTGEESGPDCNSRCETGEVGSNDCDTYCNGTEDLDSPECNGFCEPGDHYGTDCDNTCGTNDLEGSNDCTGACDMGETGPDCDDECDSGETGTDCDGSCQPGDEGSNDCDWSCTEGEDGSDDCDTFCQNADTLEGPDCDGVCQQFESSPVDCNNVCDTDDVSGSNDCNNYCDAGETGPDCDNDCDSGDALPGPDCDAKCEVGENGPDCDWNCNVGDELGSNDCVAPCSGGEEGSVDCDGGCDAGDMGVGECDGLCEDGEEGSDDCDWACEPGEAGSSDCNNYCNGSDVFPSPDCDGTCLGAEYPSVDCNGSCQPGESFYLECNYVCEEGEAGSNDCDGYCTAGEDATGTSPDCEGPCTPSDAGSPVCDGICNADDTQYVDGGPDCNTYCGLGEAGTLDCNDSCEDGDAEGSADCNGACGSNDWGGPDCDGHCNVIDDGGSPDCSYNCRVGDEAGSNGCQGTCESYDIAGSPDCEGGCETDDQEDSSDCEGVCEVGDSAWDCLGTCTAGEAGSIDCNLECDIGDTVAGGDCNNVCDPADDADSVDCNESCSLVELATSPDCNEFCQPGELADSADCNELCDGSTGEEAGSVDCNNRCEPNEGFWPDCDGYCGGGDVPGSYDCNGTCETGDLGGSADCNWVCDGFDSDSVSQNVDCNGFCDNDGENANDCNGLCEYYGPGLGEGYGSDDCDEVCSDYVENYSDDCDGVCEPDEQFGPDCDGTCDNDELADSPDCLLYMNEDVGGTVVAFTPAGNFSVTAPANAFVAAYDGSPIEGEISFSVNPNPNVGNYAFGGNTAAPESVADIHFYSGGNTVQVANGASVTVVMPLPGTTSYLLGDEVDVYYYDTTTSTWDFEVVGTVVASGDGLGVSFTGTHFSIFAVPSSPTNTYNRMAGIDGDSSCFLTLAGAIDCPGDRYGGLHLPPTDTGFISLAVGSTFGCALHGTGTITCWGDNSYGATVAPTGNNWVQISSGHYHTCALDTDGHLTCWGGHPYEGYLNPALVDAPTSGVYSEVVSSGLMSCVLDTTGSPTCWGETAFYESPVMATGLTQVAAAYDVLCALGSSGLLQCFGANSLAIPLPSGENNVALLRMGEEHLAVLRKDGTIGYWYNSTYQEDFGTPPSGNDFSAIGTSKCAMRTDGTTTCWGRDRRGGQARRNDGQAITEVALGVNGGYFLRADGSIRAWGVNYPAPSGTGYTQLVADAGNHYCALKPADNEAVCWGAEGPPTITPAAGPFTQLASASGPELANEFFKYEGTFCGLRTNGTLACWGTNTNKQATPPSGSNFVSVWGKDRGFCAVRAGNAGTTCWGQGIATSTTLYGIYTIKKIAGHHCYLHNNGTITCPYLAVTGVPTGDGFVDIAEGFDERFCAVHASGSLSCWRQSHTIDPSVIFPEGNDFVSITGSVRNGFCAIRSNGRMSCAKQSVTFPSRSLHNVDIHP